jgi:hypothetical protein
MTDITNGMVWREDLGSLRDELIAKGLLDDIPAARAFWDQAEQIRNQRQHCGTPVAAPGCKVATRYIYQVFRIAPKQLVFAQTLFGFALAAADPRIVGINFVGAEDSQIAMADYAEHMRMVAFVRRLYPNVHVSLHAVFVGAHCRKPSTEWLLGSSEHPNSILAAQHNSGKAFVNQRPKKSTKFKRDYRHGYRVTLNNKARLNH